MGPKDVLMEALGLTPRLDEPRWSALAASLFAGAIVAAILWFVLSPTLALVVFGLAAVQGTLREVFAERARRDQQRIEQVALEEKRAKKKSKQKRHKNT